MPKPRRMSIVDLYIPKGVPKPPPAPVRSDQEHTAAIVIQARYDPGTATGDFSIMIKDQTGLDADPTSSDPNLQLGFAVFGYVVDGMDVVQAIHALPPDPEKGEGWMKGQLLAEPVEIVDMRRVEATQPD